MTLFRRNILLTILALNLVFVLFQVVVFDFHDDYDEKQIKLLSKKITIAYNSGQLTGDGKSKVIKTLKGIKHTGYEIYLFDKDGQLKFSTSLYEPNSFPELEKIKEQGIHQVFRFGDYKGIWQNESQYLLYWSHLPYHPEKKPYEFTKEDFDRLEIKVIFALYVALHLFIILMAYLLNYVASRFIKGKTEEAIKAIEELEKTGDRIQLKEVGIEAVDYLVGNFNSIIERFENDLIALNKKDKELKTLIAETSHDFKTPITTIKSVAQNTKTHYEKLTKEQIKRNMSVVVGEIKFITDMLNTLLFISTLSLKEENSQVLNFSSLVEEELGNRNNKKINAHIEDEVFINANEVKLKRMLKNLIDNAIRYSNEKVDIELSELNQEICFSIENDGQSIDDIESYGIRGNTRKISEVDGIHISMGLGSVIVRKTVENMNGSLYVENIPNGGVRIKVTLNKSDIK